MPKDIICITDSRGRGLKEYLSKHDIPGNPTVSQICKGGANIEKLLHHLKKAPKQTNHITNKSDVLVIFIGGICNLTVKHSSGRRKEQFISYEVTKAQQKRRDTMKALDDLFQYCENSKYALLPATLYPVDLKKSSRHSNCMES